MSDASATYSNIRTEPSVLLASESAVWRKPNPGNPVRWHLIAAKGPSSWCKNPVSRRTALLGIYEGSFTTSWHTASHSQITSYPRLFKASSISSYGWNSSMFSLATSSMNCGKDRSACLSLLHSANWPGGSATEKASQMSFIVEPQTDCACTVLTGQPRRRRQEHVHA